jgi:NADPH2:quinone reductase
MRAMLCREYGPPSQLELAEIPTPEPGPGQVRVRVQACGVNFPDTLVIQGKYQFQPPMPFAPGTDVAGVVDALGDGVTGPAVGTPVVAFVGPAMGGFAEYALCDTQMLVPLPAGVSPISAAAFFMTYSTSYHALVDRAHVQPGESVLVLGAAGGVGIAAVELAHRLGARVIAAAATDEKLAACRESGADETINYATEDLRERVKALTKGAGVDVVYDPVGGDYTEPALRSIAWNGRYLVVGFANNAIPRIPLNLPLLKGCAIVGVFWGGFVMREPKANAANLRQLLTWLADGSLRPRVSHTYPLAEAPRALDDMLARRLIGKAVIIME